MSIRSLLLPLLLLSLPVTAAERTYRYTDSHVHYVDFFQESEGMDKLFQAMDKGQIEHAMISGIPMAKKWHEDEPKRPRYYAGDDAGTYWFSATDVFVAEAIQRLPPERQRRLHPFLTGFNPTDKNADAHIRRMLELYPGFWQGLGEVFTRHDDLTALTYGDVPRANNEALRRVYRLAAEYDLPVMLHSNITSQRERNPLYLEELEDALGKHPKVRFIWAHAGTSMEIHRHQRKLDFLLETVTRLLEDYPNLYIDLSWTMLRPYLLDKDDQPDLGWVNLVQQHPTRFMLGSDVVGQFDNMDEAMNEFEPFLDALDPRTAERVAYRNFLDVLPKGRQAKGGALGKSEP